MAERISARWEFLHNLVAHPLMALTMNSAWSIRFHDFTAHRAYGVREAGHDCEACRAVSMAMFVAAWRFMRQHWIEAAAAACGLAGSFLLAGKGEHAAWGWWAFLASNAGWITFGWIQRHWFLVLQQLGFTASSLVGIWRWGA